VASPFIPYSNIPEVTTSTSTSHTRTWSPTSTIGCLDPPPSSFAVALASKAPVWHFPPDAGWRALGFHPWPCLHRENRLIRLVIFIVVYSFSRKERLRKPWCVWSVFVWGGGVSISQKAPQPRPAEAQICSTRGRGVCQRCAMPLERRDPESAKKGPRIKSTGERSQK